ncbi:separin protein [Neophaeococcomyces mojaviensis]|uniref:Separin protein n=1 Tax=Neophaeococcomyces mojaviensis TaxID=3383035 RepID=A0ACC2ZZ24_9EURO|nr:separin protein [Knufia sp. JES_112]
MALKTSRPKSATVTKPTLQEGATLDDSTTAQDLRLLRAILDAPAGSNATRSQAKRPKLAQPTVGGKPVRARTKSNAEKRVGVHEDVPSPEIPSSKAEQKKLATKCFNSNLKVLSALVKQQQTDRARSEDATKVTSPKANRIPLQARSPNKTTTSDNDGAKNGKEVDLISHAQCASAALDVLRQEDEQGQAEDAVRRREQGAILLLEKLISLDLKDLCFAEASKIHEQCRKRWKDTKSATTMRKRSECVDLATMLLQGDSKRMKEDFNTICSFHSQILRLAILEGPSSITKDFVDAVTLETHGSPASVIIHGHKEGLLESEKAGEHLKTIAQALSKLSALAMKVTRSAVDVNVLMLLTEAQVIKLTSWKFLKHQPNLQHDLWPPFERVIRQSWTQKGHRDSVRYGTTIRCVKRLQTELQNSDFCSYVPVKLQELLAQLAEANNDPETALNILTAVSSPADDVERLFRLCKLATLELDTASTDENHMSSTITDLLSSLITVRPPTLILSTGRLLTLARLRKICSSGISTAVSKSDKVTENESGLILFKIVLAIFGFCSSQLIHTSKADDKLRHSLHLAVLKNIEAITDTEKYIFSVHTMFDEYMKAIDQCLNTLTEFENDSALADHDQSYQSAMRALRLRLSNLYWRAHLHPKAGQDSHEQAIELAQRSISALDNMPVEDLSQAALGPRLEKLASMQTLAGKPIDARKSLGRAIHHYIASQALSDAVEVALSKRSVEVWTDQTSVAFQLGRALRAYNASFEPENSTTAGIFDTKDAPDFHRAVLLSYQILHSVKKAAGSSATAELIECAKSVIKLASACQYRVWCLRFISSLTTRLIKGDALDVPQKFVVNQLIEDIIPEKSDEDSPFLKQYGTALESLLYIQQLLLMGQANLQQIKYQLGALQRVVSSCSSEADLAEVIDDANCLNEVLRACTAIALALSDVEVQSLCLTIRLHLLKVGADHDLEEVGSCHAQLAQCQIRMGHMSAAKNSLATVGQTATSNGLPLEVFLTTAEFHLAASDLDQCERLLNNARAKFWKLWSQESGLSSNKQIERDSVIARGAFLASNLAFRQGNLQLAAQYARQAAKISISIWAALSKRVSEASSTKHDLTISTLADDLSQLNLNSKRMVDVTHPEGARYWPYLDMHARSLRHMAEMMAHSGLYDDAVSFWEKLKNLASTIPQAASRLSPAGSLALLLAKSGKVDSATELLSMGPPPDSEGSVAEMLSHVEALALIGHLEQAKRFLQQIPLQLTTCTEGSDSAPQEDVKPTKPVSKARRGLSKPKAISGPAKRRDNGKPDVARTPKTEAIKTNMDAVHSLVSFDQLLVEDRRRALVTMFLSSASSNGHVRDCESIPSGMYLGAQFLVHEQFAKAKTLLTSAWQELCADSMASLLTESAVAVPSRAPPPHRKGRVSFLQGSEKEGQKSPEYASEQSDAVISIRQKLCLARRIVEVLQEERQQYCPTDMIHALVTMEARIDLLLTTMSPPFTTSSTELVLKASQPKDIALQRERIISDAEAATQDRAALSKWPEASLNAIGVASTVDPKLFQKIPSSWSIVSLTLSEDGDELLVSKVVSDRSPFLVRIPLHRSNEGEGSKEFVYEDARTEMKNIINNANSSSHDMRGTSDRATRAEWHAGREKLDCQLGTLLENIENVWLGGFRGVVAPQAFSKKLVKQFGTALEQSLDNHLPSRQKGGITPEKKIHIHEHILEIFLGLGSPDDNDLDDAIMDLLYFVVDILQFNGEKNAYDEIDWDAMLVDILDAIRTFHEAQSCAPQQGLHTILVLDKELESFPWEALPCLINHPVSRMPSLGSIFDRIALIRAQSSTASAYTISHSHTSQARGAYIINPSHDLKSTQALLEPILSSHLPTFNPVINHPPTEQEFIDHLTNNDLLLYFGHGSGAQYIRGRAIRALERCAVTWLMGCSSAKMTTCGKGESFGMPRYYMLGNSMAVVGCLWDVTDREIDRVSLQSMVEWGLVDGSDARVIEGLKKRGRKGKEQQRRQAEKTDNDNRKKTLVEAIKGGREASLLKYLCGAAVVVYGVPVILD